MIDQISNSFEENCFTLGIFVDLSKAFDTVDHNILMIKKIKLNGFKGNNLRWFKRVTSVTAKIVLVNKAANTKPLKIGRAEYHKILYLDLFICLNDLPNASNTLAPTIFVDDRNLFYWHIDIKTVFSSIFGIAKTVFQ